MTLHDRNLLRKLALALAIKLVVIVGLWWGFVRDQRAVVDTDVAARQMLGTRVSGVLNEE